MERQNLKRILAGLGIAGLLAGSSLMTGGCAPKQVSSGCGGGTTGCGGTMQQSSQGAPGNTGPAATTEKSDGSK